MSKNTFFFSVLNHGMHHHDMFGPNNGLNGKQVDQEVGKSITQ